MKTISIFLASSIAELEEEHIAVGSYFQTLNNVFVDRGLFFKFISCLNMDNALSVEIRKQDEINETIRQSDLCFFLFFTKLGEYTKEEFEIALKSFQKNNKPKILTYFKVIQSHEKSIELRDFVDYLSSSLYHYYNEFSHIDSLLLGIITNIHLLRLDGVNIAYDKDTGNIIQADEKGKRELLSISNIPTWCDNDVLLESLKDVQIAEEVFNDAKKDYLLNPDNDEKLEILNKTKNNLSSLKIDLKSKQEKVFTTLISCAEMMLSNDCSTRIIEANILLQKGKWSQAIALLDEADNDILEVFSQMDKASELYDYSMKLQSDAKQKAKSLFDQQLLNIKMRTIKACGADDWVLIQKKYEHAISLTEKFDLDKQIYFEYACFLTEQHQAEKAVNIICIYLKHLYIIKADDLLIAEALCKQVDILRKARKYLNSSADLVISLCIVFTNIEKALNKDLTADELNIIAKCYLSLAHFWDKSDIAELRDAEIFRHAQTLLALSRRVWNKVSSLNGFVFEKMTYELLNNHIQITKKFTKFTSSHRELASYELLFQGALLMANLIFYTVELKKKQEKGDAYLNLYGSYDNGECLFNLGNMCLGMQVDNDLFIQSEYFYINALHLFSFESMEDDISNRVARNYRGLIYLNLYSYWISWHRKGYVETGKKWSDFDIATGQNPNISCHDLAIEYLFKGVNLFEYLYNINPVHFANGYMTANLILGEREEDIGNDDKAIDFYRKVESVYFSLQNDDIDRNSGIHKAFIECNEKMANIFLRQNNPTKALYFYQTATKMCEKLSEKKYIDYFYILVRSYINEARCLGALGKYEIAFDLIFNTVSNYIKVLFKSDHQMKFRSWDDLYDVISVFRRNIIGMVQNGDCPLTVLTTFVDKSIAILEYIWVNEVSSIGTSKLDLLIPDMVRGVPRDCIENYVVEWMTNDYQTLITQATVEEANFLIFANKKEEAMKILQGRIYYFQGLFNHFDVENNVYLELVLTNDINKLTETAKRLQENI